MRGHDDTLDGDESAVSELTSILTLLAVAGIVVAAVGLNVLFVEADSDSAPEASFNFDYIEEQRTLVITHSTGDPIQADNLLIRGPEAEAFWSETNPQINATALIGPLNTTQINRANAYGARVRSDDRIDIIYQNETENMTVIVDQWNGTGF